MATDVTRPTWDDSLTTVYATYFGGDEKTGLEPDFETKELWEKIGCPKDHVIPGNMKDNFWGIILLDTNYGVTCPRNG
jgi:hypothetical protein